MWNRPTWAHNWISTYVQMVLLEPCSRGPCMLLQTCENMLNGLKQLPRYQISSLQSVKAIATSVHTFHIPPTSTESLFSAKSLVLNIAIFGQKIHSQSHENEFRVPKLDSRRVYDAVIVVAEEIAKI